MSEEHLCPKPYKLLQKEVAIPDGFQQFRHELLLELAFHRLPHKLKRQKSLSL